MIGVFHIIKNKEPYKELGGDFLLLRRPKNIANSMIKHLKTLGYEVVATQAVWPQSAHISCPSILLINSVRRGPINPGALPPYPRGLTHLFSTKVA